MKNKICKCGHIRNSHRSYVRMGVQSNYLHCLIRGCTCKKFEPQESFPGEKNHSHPGVPMDEETRLKAPGSDNSPQALRGLMIYYQNKPEDTLSSKIMGNPKALDEPVVKTKDIKNFIKKWVNSLVPDDKPIDCIKKLHKLAGKELL